MKVKILKLNIAKNVKQDKNGKSYKSCGLESESLQHVYFYNIYQQNDPVLLWKKDDEVDVEISDNGQWHNFKPARQSVPKRAAGVSESRIKDLEDFVMSIDTRVKELEDGRGANLGRAIGEMKKGENIDLPF